MDPICRRFFLKSRPGHLPLIEAYLHYTIGGVRKTHAVAFLKTRFLCFIGKVTASIDTGTVKIGYIFSEKSTHFLVYHRGDRIHSHIIQQFFLRGDMSFANPEKLYVILGLNQQLIDVAPDDETSIVA